MQEKADSELVRRQNRRVVLSALRRQGPLARVELGRATGLSPASITAISSQLLVEKIIAEVDEGQVPASGRRGRPITRLGLRPDAAFVLALTISIDSVSMALSDFSGNVVARSRLDMPTYRADRLKFGIELVRSIETFFASNKVKPRSVSHIGIAVQGLANMLEGSLIWSPAFRERDIPIAANIEKIFGATCVVANDANMIAEGFLTPGPESGVTATIFTGYGVGMGLIVDGRVYYGATGGASEFGHMNHIPHGAPCRCGRAGCVEAYASDYGILRTATGGTEAGVSPRAIPAEVMSALLDRAVAGDVAARRGFELAGEALGFGIARLVAILNPDRIVLAGPGLRAQRIIEPALHAALEAGVVEELRRKVSIEFVPFDTDMILRGTISYLLRAVDTEITAAVSTTRNDIEEDVEP